MVGALAGDFTVRRRKQKMKKNCGMSVRGTATIKRDKTDNMKKTLPEQ